MWIKEKKTDISGFEIANVLNPKISDVGNKTPEASSLVTTTVLKTEIRKVEIKIPDNSKYITSQTFNS